jgi:two-component system sensor histidine kinase RegB
MGHPHHAHFFQHVSGMAAALAVSGVFVTYFVHRIAGELAAQRARIEELSREQQENRFAIALGTLSAGAAHELGSPLATVQILSEEIPHMNETERASALQDIKREISRMKHVLHSMDSSELSAQVFGDGTVWQWNTLENLFSSLGVVCHHQGETVTNQPRSVVEQIARELLRNARRVASQSGVEGILESGDGEVRLSVLDDGPSLSAEGLKRAAEPFFSETGGTGLGLFLAMVHARQLGGRLTLEERSQGGTVASLVLPSTAPLVLAQKE